MDIIIQAAIGLMLLVLGMAWIIYLGREPNGHKEEKVTVPQAHREAVSTNEHARVTAKAVQHRRHKKAN